MKCSLAKTILTWILFLSTHCAWAGSELKLFVPRRWDLSLGANYYQTNANYTANGGEFERLSGQSYTVYDVTTGLRYTPSRKWGLIASLRTAGAESKNLTETRNNSAVESALLGFDFLLFNGKKTRLVPEISIRYPFKRVDVFKDETLVGEGAIESTARLIGIAFWGRFHPQVYVGYQHRDEGRSALGLYGLGLEYDFSSWFLGTEIRGYSSVSDDKYTSSRLTREVYALKNGSSLKYYSVNPSLMEAQVWSRWDSNKSMAFTVGAGTSLNGKSMAAGTNIFAIMNYRYESLPPISSEPATQDSKNKNKQKELEQFQEETNDGVDQDLFDSE